MRNLLKGEKMEIFECIKKRRSVRLYIDKEVDKEIVLRLINSAMQAPSACNRQAWKFIWVKQMETKRILEKQGSPIITKSPCGILVLYINDLSYNSYLYKDYIQSAAAAIENILLTATELGIGACWICNLQRPLRIKKKLNIPRNFDIIAYITLGYVENDDSSLSISHYGDVNKYIQHERKYSLQQTLCEEKFSKVLGDCTEVRGKPYVRCMKYLYKLNLPIIHKIGNEL